MYVEYLSIRSDVDLAHGAKMMSGLEFSETKWDKAAAAYAAEPGGEIRAIVRLVRNFGVDLFVTMRTFHLF